MKEVRLSLPLTEAAVRELELGDIVYLTGTVFQATGAAHQRALNTETPVNMEGGAVYHAYTSFHKDGNGYKFNYLGATTSAGVNKYEPEFIRRFKVSTVVGKGGMDRNTLEAMQEVGCVYLAQVGGCSALYSAGVKGISAGYWEDLGPNLILGLDVEEFGPLTVTMDAKGNSLYANVEENMQQNLGAVYEKLGKA